MDTLGYFPKPLSRVLLQSISQSWGENMWKQFSIRVMLCTAILLNWGHAQGIEGSKHDFSSLGWSGGEICSSCHTPHNAINTPDAPLWNHSLSEASYDVYASNSMYGVAEQPGPQSKLCLSCHDGTIALDSFGGATGSTHLTGDSNLGTDLSNDHPIGIAWNHNDWGVIDCGNCHWSMPIPFFDGKVECSSCHDAHNASNNNYFLRKSGSELCLHCHGK